MKYADFHKLLKDKICRCIFAGSALALLAIIAALLMRSSAPLLVGLLVAAYLGYQTYQLYDCGRTDNLVLISVKVARVDSQGYRRQNTKYILVDDAQQIYTLVAPKTKHIPQIGYAMILALDGRMPLYSNDGQQYHVSQYIALLPK